MKKIAILLFFAISTIACTTDDTEMKTEINALDLNDDSIPPTNDPRLGKDKNGVQRN